MKEAFFIGDTHTMKPIKNFPGYFIDENADIWCTRPINGKGGQAKIARKVKHVIRGSYLSVGLGKGYYRYVHQLMLETFISPRPDGMWACHGQRGRFINTLDNLYWATPQRNNRDDKLRDGTFQCHENAGSSKLNSTQVRIIRRLYQMSRDIKMTQKTIGEIFGVAHTAISRIVSEKRWPKTVTTISGKTVALPE